MKKIELSLKIRMLLEQFFGDGSGVANIQIHHAEKEIQQLIKESRIEMLSEVDLEKIDESNTGWSPSFISGYNKAKDEIKQDIEALKKKKCANKDCEEISVEDGDFCQFHSDNLPV